MITKEHIDIIVQKSENEKTALLKDIVNWAMKAELVFEEKKSAVNELKEESRTAEENVIKLLNGHIRRLESEKAELNMELQEAIEETKQADRLKEEVSNLTVELQKTLTLAETALKEKAEAEASPRPGRRAGGQSSGGRG